LLGFGSFLFVLLSYVRVYYNYPRLLNRVTILRRIPAYKFQRKEKRKKRENRRRIRRDLPVFRKYKTIYQVRKFYFGTRNRRIADHSGRAV
jgi:hypothetical protein